MNGRTRSVAVGVIAVIWALVVALRISTTEALSAKPAAIILSVVPGLALFGYVVARPTPLNIGWRMTGAAVGLALLFQASSTISSGGCSGDGLCGTMVFNGVMGDLAASALGWAATAVIEHRRRSETGRPLG